MFSSSGMHLERIEIDELTNQLEIPIDYYNSGVYLINITLANEVIFSRFIKE